MTQYIYKSPTYSQSELKTMDSYLLDFARRYRHHIVSAQWIQAFTAFLRKKQSDYLKAHPRVKPVEINCRFENGDYMRSPGAYISFGRAFVHLDLVEGTHVAFEEPLL